MRAPPAPLTRGISKIMVNIEIDGEEVLVKVIGLHRLWTLTSEIRVKRSNVTSVSRAGREIQPPWLFRVGTAIPGLICAGVLFGRRRKEFWDRTREGKGICIELANASYTRIVVDVRDPDEVIANFNGPKS